MRSRRGGIPASSGGRARPAEAPVARAPKMGTCQNSLQSERCPAAAGRARRDRRAFGRTGAPIDKTRSGHVGLPTVPSVLASRSLSFRKHEAIWDLLAIEGAPHRGGDQKDRVPESSTVPRTGATITPLELR